MKKLSKKHKNTLLILVFSAIFFVAALTPLAPGAEIQTRMMVNALGIDADDEGVSVTAETINGEDNEIVSGKGESLSEALQKMNERYGRKVEMGHCGLIALGEGLNRGDVVSLLMSILSDAKVNAGCSVVGTAGTAQKFMSDAALLTKSTGDGITGFVTFADSQASVTVPSILELMQNMRGKSGATSLPVIELRDKPESKGQGESPSQSAESESGGGQQKKSEKETEIVPPRIARVIGGEVYDLDEFVTRGLVWMTPRSTGGMMKTTMELNGKEFNIRAILKEKDASVSAEFGDKPTVTLKVHAQLRFTDRYSMLAEVEDGTSIPEVFDAIRAAYERTIKEEVAAVAEASRKDDFLGYRTKFYRCDPKKFRDWSGDLSEVAIDFDIKAEIF